MSERSGAGPDVPDDPIRDDSVPDSAVLSALIESSPDPIWSVDPSERKGVQATLSGIEERLKTFFQENSSIMLLVDPATGEIVAANHAAADFFGFTQQQLVGMLTSQLTVGPPEESRLRRERTISGESRYENVKIRLACGEERDLEVYSSPFTLKEKELLYLIAHDVTERKRSERASEESLKMVKEAQAAGGVGSYVLDFPTNMWTSSEVLDEIFGIGSGYGRSVEGWVNLIHPDDREMMAAYLADEVVQGRKLFDKEYRIVRPSDQAVRWLHGRGSLEFDSENRPLKLHGVIKDITERREAEVLLRESEERYRSTFEQIAVGILHTSLDGRFLRFNPHFAKIIGYPPEEIHGLTFKEITAPDSLAVSLDVQQKLVSGELSSASWEKRYIRKDGNLTWARVTVSVQRDADGHALHFIAVVEDINEKKEADGRLAAAARALQLSEKRYRTTFETSIDAMSLVRFSDGVYLDVNPAATKVFGYSREEFVGRTAVEMGLFVDSSHRAELQASLRRDGECRGVEFECIRKNGNRLWFLYSASLTEIDGTVCVLAVGRDISESKAAEQRLAAANEALRINEERYRKVFHTNIDSIAITRTDDGKFIDANQAFLDGLGYEREELIGRSSQELNMWVDPRDRKNLVEILSRTSECRNVEIQFRKKNGETIWTLMSASMVEIDGACCMLGITRDISNAKLAEETIRNLAFFDPLTGLPNRRQLLDRLHQALGSNPRNNHLHALLFLDLDNFKTLNDTLGHQTGDQLLQTVSRRISACIRDVDTLARLGGDEFVIMLEDLSEFPEDAAAQAQSVGEKILETVGQPCTLTGRECIITSSIGVTIFGDHRESSTEVLQQADIAMYQAKAAGRNTMRFFSPALQSAVNARALLEDELRLSIKANDFELFFQPQIDQDRLVGAEALLRWNHPRLGLLAPGEFISLAEETGLILPLGDWVLEAACSQLATWALRSETASLSVSVNISAVQFRQPDFVERVLSALHRAGARPQRLKLELTESMLLDDVEVTIFKMAALRSHGLQFSLDDFGTGYSSLSYLKRLPLDQLKIDRSFIDDLMQDLSSGAIAQAVISLSRAMGLSVIAEGVETHEQRDLLEGLGCHAFQGYLFGRPVTVTEFERRWLDSEDFAVPFTVPVLK